MTGTLTIPYLSANDNALANVDAIMADEATRLRWVQRAFGDEIDVAKCPEAWATGPLSVWCWGVLVLNGIDFDPAEKHDLTHYGIDLGFSSAEVRRFIFLVA